MRERLRWPVGVRLAARTALGIGLLASAVGPAGGARPGSTLLPSGVTVTPTAAPGAVFQALSPDLPSLPDFVAGHAVAIAMSPDASTLLILTSGYNRNAGPDGRRVAEASNEYVFVYDIAGATPVKRQVLAVPNTFHGIVWHPSGREFYVSGGVDDTVHTFGLEGGQWRETGVIPLGHAAGLGLEVRPLAAGLAVNPSGARLVVANFENDSVSVVDLATRRVMAEIDLRPVRWIPGSAASRVASSRFGSRSRAIARRMCRASATGRWSCWTSPARPR